MVALTGKNHSCGQKQLNNFLKQKRTANIDLFDQLEDSFLEVQEQIGQVVRLPNTRDLLQLKKRVWMRGIQRVHCLCARIALVIGS